MPANRRVSAFPVPSTARFDRLLLLPVTICRPSRTKARSCFQITRNRQNISLMDIYCPDNELQIGGRDAVAIEGTAVSAATRYVFACKIE